MHWRPSYLVFLVIVSDDSRYVRMYIVDRLSQSVPQRISDKQPLNVANRYLASVTTVTDRKEARHDIRYSNVSG